MIKYPEREIVVVPECNDENDNPACWAMAGEIDPNIGRPHYIWICKYDEKDYRVEDSDGHNRLGKTFKTLWGAKRAAEGVIWRQDETGAYTD